MAHCSREPHAIPLLGAGRLVVNVDTGRPNGFFQGIVPLMSDKLDKCLEAYFEQSEQLATRLILKTSERRVAGLLLQMLPGHDDARDVDAFEDAAACAATVSAEELTGLAAEDLLPKLFAGREIRLFKSHGVTHDCRCTPERLAGVVRMLGADEVREPAGRAGPGRAHVRVLQPHLPLRRASHASDSARRSSELRASLTTRAAVACGWHFNVAAVAPPRR
jgi:redox-regulated HSP33 family molecular chaperone